MLNHTKTIILVTKKTNKDDVLSLFFRRRPMDNGIDNEGDAVTDDDDDNGEGATDGDVDKDGVTDDDGDGNGATDDDVNDDNDGDDSNGAVADDDDNDDDDVDDNNLPPRIGKRNDGCDETKTEEEETVADSVAIHTAIKQITGRGGGRW